MPDEIIHLDGLDGFGFERACQRIFQKAGWGKVTLVGGVADRGRDLIIRTPDGKRIVVECKMYGNSTVGRPVVQKLHSAVIDSRADGGIVVTTGRFSKAAIEYAADLTGNHGHSIELFDMHKVMELAHDAGIEIETGRMKKIYTYDILDRRAVAGELRASASSLDSHPAPAADLMRVAGMRVGLRAMYFAAISIRQTFRTTVGVIHDIDVRGEPYMFDGGTGRPDGPDTVRFYGRPRLNADAMPKHDYTKTAFGLDGSTLRGRIISEMAAAHTARVTYKGRNNRTYTKTCVPSSRNVHVDDLRQVYLPTYYVDVRALDSGHSCRFEHNGRDSMVREQTWSRCHRCGSAKNLLLCNECGRVAHASWLGGHGFRCRRCRKTVCGKCVWKARRYLVFTARFCGDCRPANAKR